MPEADTSELLDLEDLPTLWHRLDVLYRRHEALPPVAASQILTARKLDETQPAGTRTYIAAQRYLGVAMDNHLAMVALLEHHGATYAAPWSLLRPVFEAGFFACWVLDPEHGLERRQRGLRCEVQDTRQQTAYIREFEQIDDVRDVVRETLKKRRGGAEATYREEAHQVRLSWDKFIRHDKINVRDELANLRFVSGQEPLVRATFVSHWRMLSGLEHGYSWAMLQGSDSEWKAKIPGGQEVRLTMNDSAFVTACKTALWLLLEALTRFEELHTEAPSTRA